MNLYAQHAGTTTNEAFRVFTRHAEHFESIYKEALSKES
jgi:hypothetical protein